MRVFEKCVKRSFIHVANVKHMRINVKLFVKKIIACSLCCVAQAGSLAY